MTDYSQPQTVGTDALATLGTIIDPTCGRDAIHLAVENVEAGAQLWPGQHVSLAGGVARLTGKPVGIVDPFLRGAVMPGQRFWLVVYPRQITSLRHVWEHPDFPAADAAPAPAVAAGSKATSEAWMRAWAAKNMVDSYYGTTPESAYAAAIEAGHEHSVGSMESARDEINDEWWDHWEVITGEKGDRDQYFSCAC